MDISRLCGLRFRSLNSVVPLVLAALGSLAFGASTSQAQVSTYSGHQITSPTGTLTFNWTGSVPLAAYQESGLQVSCNATDQGQGCTRCCRPFGFTLGGYYYGGAVQQLVSITRADGGAMSALEFQAGDYYNGCAYPGGDGTIYVWALVYSGGSVVSFDINAPAGSYVGFSGVFDRVQVGAYVNPYVRDLHEPTQPQAIAMDNMSYVSSPCPAFAAPSNIYACHDGTNTFTVNAVGGAPLTYQWQWQALGGGGWLDVTDGVNNATAPFSFTSTGSQSPTLTRTGSLTPGSVALYRCVVGNGCSQIASAPATIAITPAPTITLQPQDEPLCTPTFALFSVQAVTTPSDPGPLTYQWQSSTGGNTWRNMVDGESTTGSTTANLAIALDATDAARYRCIVSNACSSTISGVASLTFGNAPVIDLQPLDASICGDGKGVFDVATAGTQQTGCQWRVETPPGSGQFIDIPNNDTYVDPATGLSFYAYGTQTTDISISQVALGQHPSSIRFVAALTNSCSTVTSNPVTLTVNTADFNGDGDVGTDADIEAFFACLGGSCCASCGSADFNGDGDVGTDADIESFFRVLAGGSC